MLAVLLYSMLLQNSAHLCDRVMLLVARLDMPRMCSPCLFGLHSDHRASSAR